MKRRLLVGALTYTGLTLVTLLVVMLYVVWTPGQYDGENTQGRVVQTWAVLGLIPSCVLWIAWSFPGWDEKQ